MLSYFSSSGYLGESLCVTIVFIITCFVCYNMKHDIIDSESMKDLKMVDRATSSLILNDEVIEEWSN